MENIFYLVWNSRTGFTKHRHNDEWTAREEAKRLKKKQLQDDFYVLKAIAKAVVPVVTEDLEIERPF